MPKLHDQKGGHMSNAVRVDQRAFRRGVNEALTLKPLRVVCERIVRDGLSSSASDQTSSSSRGKSKEMASATEE